MNFYAYLWLREDGTPYYVGKGCGHRAYNGIRTRGIRPPKDHSRVLIFNRDSETEAFTTEGELIQNWGRKDIGTGCLRNFTDGGEGGSGFIHSEEAKAKISNSLKGNKRSCGRVLSEETKAKMAVASRGHLLSEETKAKISIAAHGRVFSEEHRTKISAANSGRSLSEAWRAKLSAAAKANWAERKNLRNSSNSKES